MIVEYIRYELKTHTPTALLEAYTRASEHLRAAKECLSYELTTCSEAPNSAILRICWTSAPAHLKDFRGGANFPPFLKEIRPFVQEIAEMRHYEVTSVAWARG